MAKRLNFSNDTPNDQDGIITNDVIILDRYLQNPVLLSEHRWSTEFILGTMKDLVIVNGMFSGEPVFHLETDLSKEAAGMYEKEALRGASIGGGAIWKKNPMTGEYLRTEDGYKICEAFYLYEISLVAVPSNPDAVSEKATFSSVRIYEELQDANAADVAISTFSSKFKKMPENTPGAPSATNPQAEPNKPAATAAPAAATPGVEPTILGAEGDQLPGFLKRIISNGVQVTFGAVPAAGNEPTSQAQGRETPAGEAQPTPIGLAAQKKVQAHAKYLRSLSKASTAIDLMNAKKKAKDDKDDSDEELNSAFTAAKLAAELASKECMDAEGDYEKACEAADDEEAMKANANAARTTKLASGFAPPVAGAAPAPPKFKSPAEIQSALKLAAEPTFKAKVGAASQGITFTALQASKSENKDAKTLLEKFTHRDKAAQVDVAIHATVLNSILNDQRLLAITEKMQVLNNVSMNQIPALRASAGVKRGMSLQQLASDLASGRSQFRGRDGNMHDLTFLTSTDNALAAPALNTIEWLSLAIFKLFPTTSWKASIPMFGAQMTSANTGLIWTNVTADPAVYKGTSPAPATDYGYTDTAVSLALTPYWLQPIIWKPLDMHQLRYDQQSTGWAQSFAKLNSVIDDNLIYTVASTVPAAAVIPTSGLSGYETIPQVINIPASGPQNSFYWSPNFANTIKLPTLNDILAIEQVYRNQNFELEGEKGVLVIDPIMERYLCQDPETKSLLTRFITTNAEEFTGYKHTMFDVRSRVAVYDLATGQVKDINSGIASTAVSAALGFLPSQLGMGLGLLDVFMVQDPSNYGYRMSADLRIGIAPLRFTFYGTTLYVYALGNV